MLVVPYFVNSITHKIDCCMNWESLNLMPSWSSTLRRFVLDETSLLWVSYTSAFQGNAIQLSHVCCRGTRIGSMLVGASDMTNNCMVIGLKSLHTNLCSIGPSFQWSMCIITCHKMWLMHVLYGYSKVCLRILLVFDVNKGLMLGRRPFAGERVCTFNYMHNLRKRDITDT